MSRNSKIKKEIVIILFYLVITLLQFSSLLPVITKAHYYDRIDARYFIWLYEYSYQSLINLNTDYFDAPILYPNKNTLFYGDHGFTNILVYIIFRLIIPCPLAAYNVLFIFHFFIYMYVMHLFIRYLTGMNRPAFIAALVAGFSPLRQYFYIHPYEVSCVWFILMIWSFYLLFKSKKFRYVLLFSISFVANTLTSWYYGVVGTLIICIETIFLCILDYKELKPKLILFIFLSIVIILIVLLPFVYSIHNTLANKGFERTIANLTRHSLTLTNFASVRPNALLYHYLAILPFKTEWPMFPGFCVIVLSLSGLLKKRSWPIYALIITAICFYICIGLKYPSSGFIHIVKLCKHIFSSVFFARAIFVFAVGIHIGMAILSGFGFLNLQEFFKLSIKKSFIILFIFISFIFLENFNINNVIVEEPVLTDPSPGYKYLAQLKDNAPIIELPAKRTNTEERFNIAYYYLAQLVHKHPIMNGWSSFIPQLNQWVLSGKFDSLCDKAKASFLSTYGIQYVLLHKDKTKTRLGSPFTSIFEDTNHILYTLLSYENMKPLIQLELFNTHPVNHPIQLKLIFTTDDATWCTLAGKDNSYIKIAYTILKGQKIHNTGNIVKKDLFIIIFNKTFSFDTTMPAIFETGKYIIKLKIEFINFDVYLEKTINIF
ncbi:MAG: hypothetical protein AB1765_03070 [Candidatus Hydrogenedentota bacterium]